MNQMFKVYLIVFFVFLYYSSEAQSEIKCLCSTDPTPSGVMVSHLHAKKEWMFSYRFMSMNMNENIKEHSYISNDQIFIDYLGAPDKMKMDMHMLMAMYGVTDRFSIMFMMNYISNDMSMKMLMSNQNVQDMIHMGHGMNGEHEMKTNGFGDFQLSLLYGLIVKDNYQLILSSELNIPTGSIDQKGVLGDMLYNQKRYPYSMQLGTGSFDVAPRLTYVNEMNSSVFSAQIWSNLRLFQNKYNYKYGSDLNLSAWYAYKWSDKFSSSLRSTYNYANTISGKDNSLFTYNEPSANHLNYGGHTLNGFLGSSYHINHNHRIAFEIGKALYQDVNGIQMKNNFQINASYSIKL